MTSPITVERAFRVDGRQLLVRITFPAPVVKEAGGEALVVAANRALVTLESKTHQIEPVKLVT